MTEAEHLASLRSLSQPGGPLDMYAPTASINNPEWFSRDAGHIERTSSRIELHRQIRAAIHAASPEAESRRQAIILAGPPGAGKSTIYHELLGDRAAAYLRIDADEAKRELLTHAINDGSYERWLKPAEVRQLEQVGERWDPLELSPLVHVESSQIARSVRTNAIKTGTNLVIDGVLADPDSARALGSQLHSAGYKIGVVDVETSQEISMAAVLERWRQGRAERDANPNSLGGRWVPSEFGRSIFTDDGTSRPEVAAYHLATNTPSVQSYYRYRRDAYDTGPALEAHLKRAPGGGLVPAQAADAARVSRHRRAGNTRDAHER